MTSRVVALVLTMGVLLCTIIGAQADPRDETVHTGGRSRSIEARTTLVGKETRSSKLRSLMHVTVNVPEGKSRTATVTFSAICSHTQGDLGDGTFIRGIQAMEGRSDQVPLQPSQRYVKFCSDTGGAKSPEARSFQWMTTLEEGWNRVVIKFARRGNGVGRLQNASLVVTSYNTSTR